MNWNNKTFKLANEYKFLSQSKKKRPLNNERIKRLLKILLKLNNFIESHLNLKKKPKRHLIFDVK